MKQTCQFLKRYIKSDLLISMSQAPNGRYFLRLEELEPNAAVKSLDLLVPSANKSDFVVVRLPANLEFKKIFPQYNYSCDFLLFNITTKIIMLIELKGEKIEIARKQIKYSVPFLKYLFELIKIEKKVNPPDYTIKKLIVYYDKHKIPYSNFKNGCKKSRDEKGFIVLQLPASSATFEWVNIF